MSRPRPVSRRGFLQLLVVGGGAAHLAAGCGQTALSAPAPNRFPAVLPHGASYGAIPVGGFSTEAIEAAIAAVGPLGGEVYLPEGIYTLEKTLIVPTDRLTLRGAGSTTVLQALDNSFNAIYLNARTDVTFQDLTIRGTGQDGPGGAGIIADQISRCTFDNIRIENCGSSDAAGLFMTRSSQNRIVNCHFEGNGRGLHLFQDSTANVIDGCSSHANAKEMIFITVDCTDNQIMNCLSDGDGSRAPAVSIAIHRSDRSSLTNCTVLRSGLEQGVEIAASADNAVMGCTIAQSKWAGLHIVNSIRTQVVGNTISGNQQSGITLRSAGDPDELRPCDNCVIARNLISNNNQGGLTLSQARWVGLEIEQANNTVIEQNEFVENGSAAIYIAPGNSGTRVTNNTISGEHAVTLLDEGSATVSDLTR